MAERPHPGEDLTKRSPQRGAEEVILVDLPRCIGCHACSFACKTAHDVPLGSFPLRVRWLPRPSGRTFAFVPVFSESLCGGDPESLNVGMDPACVRACPTNALVYGDRADPSARVSQLLAEGETALLEGPEATDLKMNVHYLGLQGWEGGKLNRGASLDPRDEDPIYEQR